MTMTGTSYFDTENAAFAYYLPYGYTRKDVKEKIAKGEIHIGEPPVKEGESAVLNLHEMRWFIRKDTW